jgi:murein DD-endopeptidase MepM/ murein hydrolase activator NlpD
MIYPIQNWEKLKIGYKFSEKTFYNNFHLGLDVIAPVGTPICAWQDLEVINYAYGQEGGNTIQIKCKNNKRLFRLMHLLHSVKKGMYKEGQIIAYVGNTGNKSRGSHLHIDISKNGILNLNDKNNFEDPSIYFLKTVSTK